MKANRKILLIQLLPNRVLFKRESYQTNNITFKDGRYTASLPWKSDHPDLPDNYVITLRRTQNTIRRLREDPSMLQKYDEIMKEQEKRGFIEKVQNRPRSSSDGPIHYIPHHGVKKQSATTPIRIVFDCSCRRNKTSPSLNDCLESTPPEINDLTSILMKFRLHKFAVCTDIEKAFLQVQLDERDRDATRFLWLTDINDPNSDLTMYRFKSILFGATCSPFILNATINKHLGENEHIWVSEILKKDLYVDNVISSFNDEETVMNYFRDSRKLMGSAGFNLRSWSSNSKRLRDTAKVQMLDDSDELTKILGMRWDSISDQIGLAQKSISVENSMTKRAILQETAKIYDPLGFLCPITIRAKILLQEIWRQEFDWDTPLPEEIQTQWLGFAEDLNSIIPKRYSRCYFQESKTHPTTQSPDERNSHETDDVCLHVFCDASPKAYGSVIYITSGNQSARVIARTRVAPLKQLTLPRLELMAAVIGSRLLHHVLQTIPTKSIHMWSDSQIVLHWLSSNRKLKTFEQNRVAEIHRLTDNKQWMYCPTDQNPADLLTRGMKAEELQKSKLWESGPDWLTNMSNYPKQPLMTSTVLLTDVTDQTTNIADPPSSQTIQGVHNIIGVNRYSRFRKLLRVTAYVKRFIHNCRLTKYSTDILTVQELSDAERLWINSCQATTYSAEVTCMKSGKRNLPLVRQLQLYLDEDGLIRCAGRIHNAPLDEHARFPYLLPANHQLTRLIILDAHERHLHAGTSALIAFMRQKYWIPTIRQCIQKILRTCNQCCRVTGRPYSAPDPPPLPKIRVQDTKPFTVAGVDFTGALNIRSKMGNEKAYICLFTCASTRAVHLEVVRDLSESSFVRAFRRFTSRKSIPKIMVSDNGTTFRAAANTIERLVNTESIQETLRDRGTEWKFIPKRAPWFGGWWERLIGLTKTAIKKVLGKAYVTYDTLQTVVTEIECIMNDRPLTYVTSEEVDPEPLTPAHLLYGRRISSLPYNDKVPDSSSLTHDGLTKQARVQTQLINHFRDRWVHEYLTSLRQFHKITGNNNQKIRVGDVVLIHNETKRSQWKMGKVVSLVTGRDGQSRAAMVRTSNGQTTSRPIVKLYPLETTINSRPGGCREDVCS